MGNEIKFKPATFYLGVADHLAKAVEGLKPEDMDAERGGRGETLNWASQDPEERITTEALPTKTPFLTEPGANGTGPALASGSGKLTATSNHDGASLSAHAGASTSTTLSRETDSHVYPPQRQLRESSPRDPRLIPPREMPRPSGDE